MTNLFVLEANICQALAHPKRLEIVHLLQHKPMSVGEITEMTHISQANVSQHLFLLRKLSLVTVTSDAQKRLYSLSSQNVEQLSKTLRLLMLEKYGVKSVETINKFHVFKDPICGMEIAAVDAASSVVHENKRYYFCALGCEKKFIKQYENQANI